MRHALLTTLLLLAACGEAADSGAPTAAPASTPDAHELELDGLDLAARAARADAVFAGRVVEIRHVESQPDEDGYTLPFTFVTWEVEEGLLGAGAGEQVTLRFLGGPTRDGRVLMVSDLPLFQEGQRDLVFASEEESACPLVDCAAGRLRFIGNEVFDDAGRTITRDADGRLVRGGWRDMPEINIVKIGEMLYEQYYDGATVESPDARGMEPMALLEQIELDISAAGIAPKAPFVGSDPMAPISQSARVEPPMLPEPGAERQPEAPTRPDKR